MRAAHVAVRGVHHDFGSILVAKHRRIFEDLGAGALGRACQSLSELERVEMAAARIDESAKITIAAHVRRPRRDSTAALMCSRTPRAIRAPIRPVP